jgi:hypothetical protein
LARMTCVMHEHVGGIAHEHAGRETACGNWNREERRERNKEDDTRAFCTENE